jgi:hypothetical protein
MRAGASSIIGPGQLMKSWSRFAREAEEPLVVKPDGRVVQGNTRIKVLQERGFPVDDLPREPVR